MLNFHYNNPAQIFFGDGAQQNIYQLLKKYKVTSLMFVYSGDFIKTLGIWDVIKDACSRLDIDFLECGDVVPNPKIELIRKLVAVSKEHSVDFVLAAGGGSSVDTAKAIALGIPYGGDVWDFFDGTAAPEYAVSVGAITTLPASGSETSNAAIISNGLMKLGFEDDMIIPKFAIMNPKYTLGLPAYQTSCGCADILSHLLERYFSDVSHTDTTDYMIEGAIKAALVNSLRLMKEPADYNARAEIQWLASIAHNGILIQDAPPTGAHTGLSMSSVPNTGLLMAKAWQSSSLHGADIWQKSSLTNLRSLQTESLASIPTTIRRKRWHAFWQTNWKTFSNR